MSATRSALAASGSQAIDEQRLAAGEVRGRDAGGIHEQQVVRECGDRALQVQAAGELDRGHAVAIRRHEAAQLFDAVRVRAAGAPHEQRAPEPQARRRRRVSPGSVMACTGR